MPKNSAIVENYPAVDRAFGLEGNIQVNKALVRMFGPGPALVIEFLYISRKQKRMEGHRTSFEIAEGLGLTTLEVEKCLVVCEENGVLSSRTTLKSPRYVEYTIDHSAVLDVYHQHKEEGAFL